MFFFEVVEENEYDTWSKKFPQKFPFEVCLLQFSATLFLCAPFLESFERIFNLNSNDISSVLNKGHSKEYEVLRHHQQIANEYFSRCQKELHIHFIIFVYQVSLDKLPPLNFKSFAGVLLLLWLYAIPSNDLF